MATITVRGRGVTTVAPDEVTVGLTVEALRKSAGEAFAEATRLAQQVVANEGELIKLAANHKLAVLDAPQVLDRLLWMDAWGERYRRK